MQLVSSLKYFLSSTSWSAISLHERKLFIGLLFVHFLLAGWFISRTDFTCDETGYFGYAVRWANGNQERVVSVDDSKTPIVAPALLPILLRPFWKDASDIYGFRFLYAGRWCMYVFQALGALVMLLWLHRMWGSKKWILPLLLYLFDPLVFSYSMIVGSDLPSAAIVFAIAFLAWRFTQTQSWKHWLALSLCCGVAVMAKASLIHVVPLLMLLLLLHHLLFKKLNTIRWPNLMVRWICLFVCVLFVVNAAYFFQQSFFPFQQLPQRSTAFQHLAHQFSWLGQFRVPLPYHFVDGFDYLKHNAELGGGINDKNSFIGVSILGRHFARGPVWYYYLITFFYKLPLLTMLLSASLLVLIVRHKQRLQWLKRYLFLWLPALYFFLILSLTNPFQIGIRHALLVFPFLYAMIAVPAMRWLQYKRRFFQWLLVIQMVSFVSFWPNMIAYSNELLWPKRLVYKYMNDSSISYGQNQAHLLRFLQQHPEYQLADSVPKAGKLAVTAEELANPYNEKGLFWLYKNFEPSGVYMNVIILFEITEEDLRKKGLR